MNRIKIENIGPIKNVDFELNKVNVIMGPQSSGKSTIAKIISYCQWVEKRFILDGEFKYSFAEQFIGFHRVSQEYFSKDSLIEYESDYVKLSYKGVKHRFSIKKKRKFSKYTKSKNIYIPAERNFVSVIPNLGKYKESNDNIMSFLYDWYDTKRQYSKFRKLPILNLNVEYHHIEEGDSDILTIENNKEISLKNASSGLQSVIPLTMLIDYLSNDFFNESSTNSVDEKEEITKIFVNNFTYIIDSIERMKVLADSFKDGKNEITLSEKELSKIIDLLALRTKYYYSSFIIEEPEQNLYPETQRDFVYFLLKNILNEERNHQALLTTHSPFILYALNNCMMGNRVSENLTEDEKNNLLSYNSWINPDLVSVWEIDKTNGTLKDIKDPKTGTISKNFFNQFTNELMNEYYEMLSVL